MFLCGNNCRQDRQEWTYEQSSSAVTKVSEGGAGKASGAGAEIPWQPMGEDCGEPGCAPVVCGGPRWSRHPLGTPGDPHAEAGGCPKETGTLWEACAGGCSWQDLWIMERAAQAEWSMSAARTCDPTGNPRWSSLFLKDCTLCMGPVLEQWVHRLQPMGRTHVGDVHGG